MLNKILFFGNERLATGVSTSAPTFRSLIEAGYEISGLVLAQSDQGPSRKNREPEVVQVAREHQIPILTPAKLREAATDLTGYGAHVGVLVAYGKIVPQSIMDIFSAGIVNIHPSLLPRHRGPTPIESAMLSGERRTGVSLMRLSKAMDAGPVYAQRPLELDGDETKQELADKLLNAGDELLLEHLPAILDGSLEPQAQDDTAANYDELISKDVAWLDWRKPAERLAREVRAYAGWPRSRAIINGLEVIITRAHPIVGQDQPGKVERRGKQLIAATSDGLLVIDSLLLPGKKEMSAEAFMLGYFKS